MGWFSRISTSKDSLNETLFSFSMFDWRGRVVMAFEKDLELVIDMVGVIDSEFIGERLDGVTDADAAVAARDLDLDRLLDFDLDGVLLTTVCRLRDSSAS